MISLGNYIAERISLNLKTHYAQQGAMCPSEKSSGRPKGKATRRNGHPGIFHICAYNKQRR